MNTESMPAQSSASIYDRDFEAKRLNQMISGSPFPWFISGIEPKEQYSQASGI
jgi:hypothetical protein